MHAFEPQFLHSKMGLIDLYPHRVVQGITCEKLDLVTAHKCYLPSLAWFLIFIMWPFISPKFSCFAGYSYPIYIDFFDMTTSWLFPPDAISFLTFFPLFGAQLKVPPPSFPFSVCHSFKWWVSHLICLSDLKQCEHCTHPAKLYMLLLFDCHLWLLLKWCF